MEEVKTRTPKSHNEEFLAYNSAEGMESVPSAFVSKINKTKFARKSQSQFLKDCCEIVGKILQGGVQPVNHVADSQNDYYIFSELFISKARSNSDNWRMPPNDSEITTYSVVNAELRNLQTVVKAELPKVNLINTVLVDRLGQRFVMQNLLEGMLYFNPKTWGKYGTFDEGKTFEADAEFEPIMRRLCEAFWITRDNKFVVSGESGEEKTMHGSPEVKGIVAGDGRTYVMDLLRMSPRDLNFRDDHEHQSCLLRPELIKNFQTIQTWKKMYAKNVQDAKNLKKVEEKKEEEKNKDKKVEKEDKKEKEIEKDESNKGIEKDEKNKNSGKNIKEEKLNGKTNLTKKEEKILTVNPSLFTTFASKNEEERDKEDIKNLETLSNYLLKEAVPGVLAEISDQTSRFGVVDCESLVKTMHKNGVNTRYLGMLHSLVSEKGDPKKGKTSQKKGYEWVHQMISFTILVRSFVKILREVVQKFDHENAIEVILQCLNLLLGDEGIRSELQKKFLNGEASKKEPEESLQKKVEEKKPEKEEIFNSNKKKNKRRKKKKNKKKAVVPNLIVENPTFQNKWFQLSKPCLNIENSYKSLTFEFIKTRMLEIAQKKYSFKEESLPLHLLNSPHNKLRFLREVFIKLALKLNPKSAISFSVQDCLNKGAFRAPLKPNDISEVGYKVKGINHFIEEIQYNILAAEKEFKKGNVVKALATLEMYLPVVVNIYGLFHLETIKVLVRLGTFNLQSKLFQRAVSYKTLAFLISLRLNGPHDLNTANILTHLSSAFLHLEKFETSLRILKFTLKSWDLIGGPLNPHSFNCLTEMQRIAVKTKNISMLEKVLNELEKRNSSLYGKADQRNLGWLSHLARLKAGKGDFSSAVDLQTRHSFILRQLIRKYEASENKNEKKEEVEQKKRDFRKDKLSYFEYYKLNLEKNFNESEKLKDFYKSKLQ